MKPTPRLWAFTLACGLTLVAGSGVAIAQSKQPNILVIWGDDIGTWNISHNNRGMVGYDAEHRPNRTRRRRVH